MAGAKRARAATGELRAAVYACVDELRASGRAPEQVVSTLKALTAQAGVKRSSAIRYARSADADRFEEDIMDAVVRWSIEAYYDPPPSGRVGRAD